jgi:hypothetical protein
MDDDGDEYDAYNLSEFSAADFSYIDGTARQHQGQHEYDATAQGAGTRVVASESGGPQIAVALETAADESVVVKAAVGRSGSVEILDASQGLGDRRKGKSNDFRRPRHRVDTRSPFERYRSRGTLSVSDLVGPAWCVLIIRYCRSRTIERCVLLEGVKFSLTMDSVRDGPALFLIDLNFSYLPKERLFRWRRKSQRPMRKSWDADG